MYLTHNLEICGKLRTILSNTHNPLLRASARSIETVLAAIYDIKGSYPSAIAVGSVYLLSIVGMNERSKRMIGVRSITEEVMAEF